MSPAANTAPAFTLYDYVLSGNCYKIRLAAALLGPTGAQARTVAHNRSIRHAPDLFIRVATAPAPLPRQQHLSQRALPPFTSTILGPLRRRPMPNVRSPSWKWIDGVLLLAFGLSGPWWFLIFLSLGSPAEAACERGLAPQ